MVMSRPRLAVPQGCGPTAQVVCCLELAAMAGCTGLSNISLAILVGIDPPSHSSILLPPR